jgi:DNA sulfur modification protein DndB
MLVEQHSFFSKFLLVKKGKAIPATDKRFFTTLETLYDVIDTFLSRDTGEWRDAKKFRPSDQYIRREYKRIVAFWDSLIDAIPALSDLKDSDREDQKAASYRSKNGGHLLYRPVGLMLIVEVIKDLLVAGYKQEDVIAAIASVPMLLTDTPWAGLLWDVTNKRMIMSSDNRTLAKRLMVYGLTARVELSGKTELEMRQEWAGITGKTPRNVALPHWSRLRELPHV